MANLFIKGVKEPFNISREQGLIVEKIMKDTTTDEKRIVSVAGWTGPKKDIRFVVIEKERAYSAEKVFTNEQARAFEKEVLQPYLKNGQLSMRDEMRFYADNGGARVKELKDDPKTATDFDFAIIDPGRYNELRGQIDAWNEYRGKVAYAKKKEAEDLQAIADQGNG